MCSGLKLDIVIRRHTDGEIKHTHLYTEKHTQTVPRWHTPVHCRWRKVSHIYMCLILLLVLFDDSFYFGMSRQLTVVKVDRQLWFSSSLFQKMPSPRSWNNSLTSTTLTSTTSSSRTLSRSRSASSKKVHPVTAGAKHQAVVVRTFVTFSWCSRS